MHCCCSCVLMNCKTNSTSKTEKVISDDNVTEESGFECICKKLGNAKNLLINICAHVNRIYFLNGFFTLRLKKVKLFTPIISILLRPKSENSVYCDTGKGNFI